MSNQATNTAATAAPAKAKKPSIVDTFLKGCAKGFKVGIENITPAMILGYVLVYILKETSLMDTNGIFDGVNRSQSVYAGTDAADTFNERPRIARVARPLLPCMRLAR